MTSPSSPAPGSPTTPAASTVPASGAPTRDPGNRSSLVGALLVYTALRLLLVAVITAVLMIFMPLIVALLFVYALQLPLAYVLFGRSRRQVNDAIARATARRRSERARLQDALTGGPGADGPRDSPRDSPRDNAGDPVVLRDSPPPRT